MNWDKLPLGMMRHDELLAILKSLQFTMHRANRGGNPEYVTGFDDALSAVAQAANLQGYFEPLSVEMAQLGDGRKGNGYEGNPDQRNS